MPAQEDIAAFQNGRKPTNLLVRQFANEAELSAYKEGLGCIEDEFDEVDGLNVVGCKVTFTRATDEKDAADVTELVFATTGEAQACYEGVGDAEGMHAPFVVGPDEEGYELLAAFEAGKEAEPTAQLGLDISMSAQERDALLAALKLLEGALKRRLVIPNDGNIGDLLTNGGEHEGLTPQKIADLADRIVNAYPAPQVAPATEHQANKARFGHIQTTDVICSTSSPGSSHF